MKERDKVSIILAAGDSTRLVSQTTKVLHTVLGKPMLDYVLDLATVLGCTNNYLVIGKNAEQVQAATSTRKNLHYVLQKQRLGTAHAVLQVLPELKKFRGDVLILSGDVPLLSKSSLQKFYLAHLRSRSDVSLMTAHLPNPFGYGRILRNQTHSAYAIVEEKNATSEQKQIKEINAGIYWIKSDVLNFLLPQIKKDPIKQEYYLTEILALALKHQFVVNAHVIQDYQEILGVNTRAELAGAQFLARKKLIEKFLISGVTLEDPATFYPEPTIKIASDVTIAAQVHILGKTQIASGVVIEEGCHLKNVKVEAGVQLKAYSYLEDCVVKKNAVIGPFARIRPDSVIGEAARVGNFVELKKTKLGAGAKVNHLSYLGDADIGKNVNVGAGNITCNYDGKNKFKTMIAEGAFLGSDVQMVAPVKIGKNAYVGAGTTVTKNVPADALAISRVQQKNILAWAKRKK